MFKDLAKYYQPPGWLELQNEKAQKSKWRGSQTGIRYPDFESCECGAHATKNPDLHSEWCPKHVGVKRD